MESGHEQMSERCAWPPNPNPNPNPNPIPIPIPNGDGGSSCTRWNPTAEQLKMLRELYYSSGIRCPTPDQIQRISWALSRYGKIEGKNVFYWFQNHKARERQKKRFFTTCTCMQAKRESQSPPLTLFSASSAKTMGYSEENSRRSFPCSFNKDLDCEDANGVSEDNNNHPVETLDLFPMKNGVQN